MLWYYYYWVDKEGGYDWIIKKTDYYYYYCYNIAHSSNTCVDDILNLGVLPRLRELLVLHDQHDIQVITKRSSSFTITFKTKEV